MSNASPAAGSFRWWGFAALGATAVGLVLVLLLRFDYIRPPGIDSVVIERSVDRRSRLLEKAFTLPTASKYGRGTYYQTHSSFCGPASLVNVLRSMGYDTGNESALLSGTGKCRLGFCWMGLTLDELAELARVQGRLRVTILRNVSSDSFLEHLRRSNDPHFRYIVNFTRERIFGHGAGHHSPIGGYLEAEDRVLVLDVNQHFGAWVIERERLYEAMNTLDGTTKRGLLVVESLAD